MYINYKYIMKLPLRRCTMTHFFQFQRKDRHLRLGRRWSRRLPMPLPRGLEVSDGGGMRKLGRMKCGYVGISVFKLDAAVLLCVGAGAVFSFFSVYGS